MTRMTAALVAAMMMLLLSGCAGDSGAAGVATLGGESDGAADDAEEQDLEEQMLEFTQCMRDNGVDMPDPEINEDGGVSFKRGSGSGAGPMGADREAVQDAMEACQHLRPEGGGQFSPEDRAEMQDQMLALAQCMRDHGVDMPDPDVTGEGGFRMGGPDGVDMDDPEVQEAFEECRDEADLPGRGMRGGS